MKILVCISCVPDTTTKINFTADQKEFDAQGVQYIINPNDEFGLTRAIRLQQSHGAHVTVVTVGEVSCEQILRKCLAIGADAAVRIDAHPNDGYFVAKQLEAICIKQPFDLIITGRESIDYNGGMVGGMLATLMQLPYVTQCVGLEINGDQALMQREIDGGNEHSKANLPVVIGAQKGLVEEKDLIIPNMRGIMQARQKPLLVEAPLTIEAKSQIEFYEKPKPRGPVTLFDPSDVDGLLNALQNQAKVL